MPSGDIENTFIYRLIYSKNGSLCKCKQDKTMYSMVLFWGVIVWIRAGND